MKQNVEIDSAALSGGHGKLTFHVLPFTVTLNRTANFNVLIFYLRVLGSFCLLFTHCLLSVYRRNNLPSVKNYFKTYLCSNFFFIKYFTVSTSALFALVQLLYIV